MPLFGTAATAFQFGAKKAASAPRYAQWAIPAVAGGIWFIWPAVDEEWKQSIFTGSPAAESAGGPAEDMKEEPVVLSEEAKNKIEKAYVVETAVELTDDEKAVMKAVQKGDFTLLEKEWDSFQVRASNPEEDDDDDDVSLSIVPELNDECSLFFSRNGKY